MNKDRLHSAVKVSCLLEECVAGYLWVLKKGELVKGRMVA